MKFGVVVFPGSNCDQDMIYVLRNIMEQEVVELWHKDTSLQGVEAVVLPGGFSYGDYLRSGAIARYSPIMEKVIEFAHRGGFVFGVCNGFHARLSFCLELCCTTIAKSLSVRMYLFFPIAKQLLQPLSSHGEER